MVQQEVGYRISDSPSDNPTIKKSDNPLPVRALKTILTLIMSITISFIFRTGVTITGSKFSIADSRAVN